MTREDCANNDPNRTGSPMTREDAVAAVTTFSDAILTAYQPVKVVLYGSYARGDQQASSDIDVAVIVDQITGDFRILFAHRGSCV